MHTLFRNEATADENPALLPPSGTVSTNDIASSNVIVDAQYVPSRWRGFINALYQARMWSAQRETERHADMILFWRRGLAERGAHLRAVAGPRTAVANDDVDYRSSAPLNSTIGHGGRWGLYKDTCDDVAMASTQSRTRRAARAQRQ